MDSTIVYKYIEIYLPISTIRGREQKRGEERRGDHALVDTVLRIDQSINRSTQQRVWQLGLFPSSDFFLIEFSNAVLLLVGRR